MGDIADDIIGDMFDWYGDNEWTQEDEWPLGVVCKYCHRPGLHWVKTKAGWRTADIDGLHDCPKFKRPF